MGREKEMDRRRERERERERERAIGAIVSSQMIVTKKSQKRVKCVAEVVVMCVCVCVSQ